MKNIKKRFLPVAAVIITAFILMASFCVKPGEQNLNKSLIAKAVFVKGDVFLKRTDSKTPIKQGDSVRQGDAVVTGDHSFVSLQISELGVIKVNANTEFSFNEINSAGKTSLNLKEGSVFSNLKKLGKEQAYNIITQTYTASVRGTEFLTMAGKSGYGIKVLSGVVNVTTVSASSDHGEKKGVNVGDDGTVREYQLDELELMELKKEALFKYIEDPDTADRAALDIRIREIDEQTALIDAEMAKLSGKPAGKEKLSPLDRLRKMNKPLTMIYLSDGSQIAGSVLGQKKGKLKIDTGEGIITVPVNDIVRRIPIK